LNDFICAVPRSDIQLFFLLICETNQCPSCEATPSWLRRHITACDTSKSGSTKSCVCVCVCVYICLSVHECLTLCHQEDSLPDCLTGGRFMGTLLQRQSDSYRAIDEEAVEIPQMICMGAGATDADNCLRLAPRLALAPAKTRGGYIYQLLQHALLITQDTCV